MAKSASRQVSVFLNGTQVEGNIKAISGAFKQAQNELNGMTVGGDKYLAKLEEVKKLKAPLDEHNKQLRGIKGGLDQAKGGLEKFVGVAAGAFAVESIVNFTLELGQLGVNMEQMEKKARTVFAETLPFVTSEAEKNAAAMGLTNNEYINAAANIQDLLVPMGFQRKEAAQISTQMVNLSGALAEWSEAQDTAQDVTKILNNAILGEREELKGLGISISQADVDAALLSKGLNNLTGASKQQAEASATLELILAKSADAQAAYAANTDSTTRRQAEMAAKTAEIAEKLATVLLPVFEALLEVGAGFVDVAADIADGLSSMVNPAKTATAAFDEQSEKVTYLTETIDPLLGRYEELTSKSSLSKKEQDELRGIIDKVSAAVPAAVTEFDKYGKALGINTGLVRDYIEAEKERLKYTNATAIGAVQKDLAALEQSAKNQRDIVKGLQNALNEFGGDAAAISSTGQQIQQRTQEIANLENKIKGAQQELKRLNGDLLDTPKTVAPPTAATPTTSGGKSASKAEIEALKVEAEWRKINADMIRQKPIIQAEVEGLIAEQQTILNEQARQKSLEALNLQLQDYIDHKAHTKLVDLNYEEEKAAALETIRVDLLTEREKEIEELSQHYTGLLALAERYGIDVKKLKEKFEKEIKEIEDKYRDQKEKAEQEAQDKKVDAINKNLTAYGQLIQAGFDFIEDESSRSIDFQKVAALAQIAIDTAKAISSLTAASAANPSNSFTFGAAGAAQFVSGLAQILANVAAAKKVLFGAPKVTQKYEGGYMVTGATDGRSYSPAMIAPPSTGMLPGHPVLFQSRATGQPVLASERGPEYFVSAESLRDPYVANMVRMIDLASSGRRVSQFADGGVNPPTAAQTTTESSRVLGELATALTILNRILGSGINAVLPDDTLINAKKRFDKINDNTGGYYG